MCFKQRGMSSVEMIIALPILILFMVMVIEVARVMIEMNTLNKAVRVGARYASTLSGAAGCGPILNESGNIQKMVVYGSLGSGVTALLDNWGTSDIAVSCENNQYVTVTASYTFQPRFVSKIPYSETSLAIPMNASTVMRLAQ
ncbi:hypothetical protein VroAM7_50980 (plasmid) [Vibrio rotiferianus]|uniref:TadE-like domain-containing protein n=1 Tax=Vibrio rotiferianus TaxID=190895 RepID=A0A510IF90_9VIBR|nr:TadE family protein [Vibrio rotiferianus]BBL92445.1 hypothetical protein VroAM7_50980 [Vibrio rotiferianus]